MQLMPATARTVAQKLKIPYSVDRLTADPSYNLTLGHAYLAQVIDGFNGSYVMALAGYNAGPGRVRAWSNSFGDPRDSNVDVIDWIEQIPFNETRNYVQRVLEVAQIYHLRLTNLAPGAPRMSGTPGGVAWCLLACTPPARPEPAPTGPAVVPVAAQPTVIAPTE
jgi:soluble lytic murein transglycosylase